MKYHYLFICVIFQGIDILPQDLKLTVRLNHKQESTAKQGKYFRSIHKINICLYACYMCFTNLSGTIGEHLFLLPVEIILIGVKIWGFQWCV